MRKHNTSLYKTLRHRLRQLPWLVSIKRRLWRTALWKAFDRSYGTTTLDLLHTFPLYSPYSAGNYKDKARLTIQTINETIPLLVSLAHTAGAAKISMTSIRDFPASDADLQAASELKQALDKFGSDKANTHDYHYLYGPILKDRSGIKSLLEIGMGTDNPDVVSNMGTEGKPGASLRAFQEFLTDAKIYGADIDERILFNEGRIQTHFVDQTDRASFDRLDRSMPDEIDLIIDDGLHSPNANLVTLHYALRKVSSRGWIVIEDISPDAIPVWELVAVLLRDTYRCQLLRAAGGIVFAVNRVS